MPWLIAVVCFVVSLVLAPRDGTSQTAFERPPNAAAMRVAALGRSDAASSLLWLRTIQMIGDADAAANHYPKLEYWIDTLTSLSPRFAYAYQFAAIMLSADAQRLEHVDRILARGEVAIPGYFIPLQRGYVAYFGMFDNARAAEHFKRAAQQNGAPPYLAALVRRLETAEQGCREMQGVLDDIADASDARAAATMREQRLATLEACVQNDYRRARGAYVLEHGEQAKYAKLVEAKLMQPAPSIRGLCWDTDDVPKLVDCDARTPKKDSNTP